ncbi:MAG TPA: SAM-dependent methyltransferase [Patescibacteria group bacterium]|jgi:23S rRNA (cytidine1920-2'-O)/16S rRNA (cytidine1409-2'-O)-methyltransferase|nr:SAM-dependent methyltransferase [Patescibacteria group bacterium]
MNTTPFASRAGEKLDFALKEFGINVTGLTCADFGASVGGFVDCLLRRGAKKVYAVETGYGELAWKLRNDPRVAVLEKTNAMHVVLPDTMDLITNDTSWTKQEKIFPNILTNLTPNGSIVTLIKPHYEADKKLLRKGKLEETTAELVAKQVYEILPTLFPVVAKGLVKSPLIGSKGGNSEFIAFFQKI